MKRKTVIWDRLTAALGEPEVVGKAVAMANDYLPGRSRLSRLRNSVRSSAVRTRTSSYLRGRKMGSFMDYWSFSERAAGHSTPSVMVVGKDGRLRSRIAWLQEDEVADLRATYVRYWRREKLAELPDS
jgi:hypothetical protein